jgi:hypothetical protein
MPITLVLVAAAAGVASAVLQASLLTGSFGAILLAYLAQLPLFLVGLSLGVGAGAIAATVATALLAVFGGVVFALTFAAVNAAPAILMMRQALLSRLDGTGAPEWYPPGTLLTGLVGGASLLFLGAAVWFASAPGGLEGQVRAPIEAALNSTATRDWAIPQAAELATAIARILPGVVGVSWLLTIVFNGALAQGLLKRFGYNLRPHLDIRSIELPRWLHIASAICGLGMLFGGNAGFIAVNLLLILALAYFIQGLAVIHSIVARWNQKYLWLTAIYILFVIMWPAGVLVVLLGAVEPWAQLRRRFAASQTP